MNDDCYEWIEPFASQEKLNAIKEYVSDCLEQEKQTARGVSSKGSYNQNDYNIAFCDGRVSIMQSIDYFIRKLNVS